MSNERNSPSDTPRDTGVSRGRASPSPSPSASPSPSPSASPSPGPNASFFRVVGAVLSAFVGIRKRQAADRDVAIKPAHVVIAGIIAGLVFIAVIVTVVRLVVPR